MNYSDLTKELRLFSSALMTDRLLSYRTRSVISSIASFGIIAVALLTLPLFLAPGFSANLSLLASLADHRTALLGMLLLLVAIELVVLSLTFYINSYYYDGSEPDEAPRKLSWESARALYEMRRTPEDSALGFFLTSYGHDVLMRLGVGPQEFVQKLKEQGNGIPLESLQISSDWVTINVLAHALYAADSRVRDVFFSSGVQEEDFRGATDWIQHHLGEIKAVTRSWGRERLSRIPGIGKAWSYGRAFTLEKFGTYIEDSSYYQGVDTDSPQGKREAHAIESVLERQKGANVILLGTDRASEMQIIARLAKEISEGRVMPSLEAKTVFLLTMETLVAAGGEKMEFEQLFAQVLDEAEKAGNLIVVIDDLPVFMESARALGSDAVALLSPYLNSADLHFIALSDPGRFYRELESRSDLLQYFEKVAVEEIDQTGTVRLVAEAALAHESRENIFFTYQAIKEIALSSERYFSDGVMPDKALDLLLEVIPFIKHQGRMVVTKQDILALVESKTGIPTGEVKTQEREKLLNLETELHKRVIGQNEAVAVIANAMRRSRAGIRNQDRPIGSFLFLGPTGVGKTETAKALAEAFFGSDTAMIRLDMTEYQTPDATDKLIGSFESGNTGVLTTALREHPYAVLLLDEFEKASSDVQDLFLQILDEGKFSDMSGRPVNARNTIIIATSNAGSELIWKYLEEGGEVASHKDELINTIITKGIFKPELVNRFSATVIFTPSNAEEKRAIATLMLEGLKKRMRERGIDLAITPALVDFVATHGNDPKFGARAMTRVIQEDIEEVIAEKIIRGDIAAGSTLELSPADLERASA